MENIILFLDYILKPIKKKQIVKITYEFICNLHADSYSVSIGVANKGKGRGLFEEYLLLIHDVDVLKVIENSDAIIYSGFSNLNPRVSIQ